MKKLLLFSFLALSATSFTYDRNAFLNAIIESDYASFISNYDSKKISDDDRMNFLEMNDQVITLRQKWVVAHYMWPQFGKDLLISYFGSLTAILASQIFKYSVDERDPASAVVGFAGMSVGFYFSITKYIDAFKMPKKLFANAMKIKDALLNNN